MGRQFKKIFRYLQKYYYMPREFKVIQAERNLKRLLYTVPILLIFSLIMLILTVIREYPNYNTIEFAYYGTLFAISLITIIMARLFRFHYNLYPLIKNIPLYFIFIGMLHVCFSFFFKNANIFNTFIVFICVVTIIPLAFAVEPFIYNTVLIISYFVISRQILHSLSFSSVLNVFIYVIILFFLANLRWINLVKNMNHEKMAIERENVIKRELEMASMVQKSFYTHDLSNVKDWEVVYYNNPMISLSGDLFDFFVRQDKLSGLCIFDVSGHGLSSGLVTMMVKNTMEEEFYENEDVELGFTMQRINERVRREKGNIENYLTGIMVRLGEEKVELVNAGHPVPIIYNAVNKSAEYMKCSFEDRQGVIGLGDLEYFFNTLELTLAIDDRIVLYTDGITEATNIRGEQYGKERFLQSVQAHSELGCQEQMEEVIKDVMAFIGDATRTDDISIIIVKKR